MDTPTDQNSTDLTPAEQAAADVLAARHNAADATYSYSAAAFHGRARAVVAAVRPLIEADAFDQLATHIDALPPGGEALQGPVWYRDGLRDAAAIALALAAARRTPLHHREDHPMTDQTTPAPLTDDILAAARNLVDGDLPEGPGALQAAVEIAEDLLAEVDRLRAALDGA